MFQIYIIIALVIITLLIIIILTFQHDSNVYNWFQHDAEMINKPLHIRSGWGYLSEKHFNEMTNSWLHKMNPPINQNESVFEMGCGVGAILTHISNTLSSRMGYNSAEFSSNLSAHRGYDSAVECSNLTASRGYNSAAECSNLSASRGYDSAVECSNLSANRGYDSAVECSNLSASRGYDSAVECSNLSASRGYNSAVECSNLSASRGYDSAVECSNLSASRVYNSAAECSNLSASRGYDSAAETRTMGPRTAETITLDGSKNHIQTSILVGGSDFSPNAIQVAKNMFKSDNFYCLNMIDKHPIPDNSIDHVISAGALGMYLKKEEMVLAIKEAVRMTKPGGSLCFTHFLEKNGRNKGSIIERVDKSYWISSKDELGIDNIIFGRLKHQGDRYFFTCTKNL